MLLEKWKMKRHKGKIEKLIKKVLSNDIEVVESVANISPQQKVKYRTMEDNNQENYLIIRREDDDTKRILFGYRDMSRLNKSNAAIDIKRIFLYDWIYKDGTLKEGAKPNKYIKLEDILGVLNISL
ncbi:hypothetical protein WKH56_07865 [Priestia sp. SB1]|uniref:Uncharacterized protein n=1 Tax=Priestia aryabhattai TaxID=412384 RepID=A0AAX6NEH8_PRIAR|nr:hypothetical protein [Priestia aryabhattai]MDU9694146.1 hypothetical protein [Priestia aryabhattai]NGY88556.1 hypothetical protein [Priestia megaterium]